MLSKIKYLGLFLGENLSFKYHLDTINLKLNRANCLLSKIRRYVRAPSLRTIYFAIFNPHLSYGCQIWGQNKNYLVENIDKPQNKAIRILNFKGPLAEASNLYKKSKIYTLKKQITTTENCRFVYDQIKKNIPKNFNNYFAVKKNQHQYNTRTKKLDVRIANTDYCGSNSITL